MEVQTQSKKPILITGFGAFSATSDNPSAHLAKELDSNAAILEVSYQAIDSWRRSVEIDRYSGVLHLGYADRPKMTPELIAYNECGPHLDVRGVAGPVKISQSDPAELASTLWCTDDFAGYPTEILSPSTDPGRYLCNAIYFGSLASWPTIPAGFLHVPSFMVIPLKVQLETVRRILSEIDARAVTG